MSERFTKSMARNIYYGGGAFFFLLFLGLTFDTVNALPKRENREHLTESVAAGKALWEKNNCIGCHSLLGEGAYFAPNSAMCSCVAATTTNRRSRPTSMCG